VHSLHGYFIRAGRTDRPIIYEAERTRDGGSFTTRRVVAIQDGETIFSLSASFQRAEPSSEHQAAMPEVAGPDDGDLAEIDALPIRQAVLEIRYIGDPGKGLPDEGRGPRQRLWVRAKDRLPDAPLSHVCALTYISDIRLAGTAGLAHRDEPVCPSSPRWTTPCGSTARSAPTSGCCSTWTAPATRPAGGWPEVGSSARTAGWWPR